MNLYHLILGKTYTSNHARKIVSRKSVLSLGPQRTLEKSIALELGENGAIVYITGRTLEKPEGQCSSRKETAREIEQRGGQCILLQCDHANDDIKPSNFLSELAENDGTKKKWPHSQRIVCGGGGLRYLFNVCYGIGKEDCGLELRKHNVAFVSLWQGTVRTENLRHILLAVDISDQKVIRSMNEMERAQPLFENGDSTEFSGKCIVGLATDPNVMKKSGKILLTCDLGEDYGFLDKGGRKPFHMRQFKYIILLRYTKLQWVAS
ncbi:hypothetical protein CHS0354_042446 [Potamilus streckersoni]|uniref:Uncharacterized protein n=1 Tax=Potamilus streckersoni TaxID=2493646 RepID=A0AAE0S929_9BIVA|nr:hypothetical protein CHS0354_042446 [Potamilus streckersoni]